MASISPLEKSELLYSEPPGAPQTSSAEARLGKLLLGVALLIVLLFHGVLLFNQQFIHTYDALIHIFFGAHYAQTWFDPWEPRWYTGFLTIAYPPLSHYLIALSGKLVGFLTGFAFVQLFALLQLTVGVYRVSKLLTTPTAAGYASVALALSSAVAETVHIFGQLPTTLSLGFLLNAIPFVWDYIRLGRPSDLLKSVLWTAATTAGHHVTTLFGSVFFTGPLIVVLLLAAFRSPRPGEPTGEGFRQRSQRRLYRLLPRLYRTGVFGVLAIMMLVLVVFPYWYWSGTDPILQVSIPHGSRANFLERLDLGLMFWVIPWASTIWFLPYAVYKGLFNWRWPVVASILLLFVLGTGGTTPVPRLLLRGAFDILTLDRFTYWSTMLILPFVGMALESVVHGRLAAYLDANLGRRVRLLLLLTFLVATCASALTISTLTRYRKTQPDPIDVAPIVNFIEKDEHWRYRYLTLGFGDQMAWLSANTRATTPDGNYHSARRLPELTTTPVERLEGAKYTGVPGIGSLEQFLTTPEKYNLKFVFSNDAFYDPVLFFNGWHRLGRLENGIQVWEREDIAPLPERLPRKTWPVYQRVMWGVLPMLAPVLAFLALLLPRRPARPAWWQRRGLGRRAYRLLKEDALPEQPPGTWQPWRNAVRPLESVLDFSRRPLRERLLATGLLGFILIFPVVYAYNRHLESLDTPTHAVVAYWDDLDFKRFGEAYGWLGPQSGLTFERWTLDISVVGGLRSGYAKLGSIQTEVLAYEGEGTLEAPRVGDRALVRAELHWFTALAELRDEVVHDLVRAGNGWRILAAPRLKARPQERFIGQPEVAYYRAPRRLTTDTTAAGDVLDRPRLSVLEARLVSYEAEVPDFEGGETLIRRQFSIVGTLQNVDARPADLTLTGVLRDERGAALSRANAGTAVMHKLLPGETTPFRIDFDAVAAPEVPDAVADFEVFAKAVVTSRNLERDLASWTQAAGDRLELRAANVGTREATLPHALLSLFDEDGLAWVDEAFGLEAVPPREARSFTLPLTLPPAYRTHAVYRPSADEGTVFDSLNEGRAPATFDLEHPDLSAYLVQLHAFYREE